MVDTGSLPGSGAGIFLTMEELAAIFPRLKKNEAKLDFKERQVLGRMERVLYKNLSIEELENRLRGSVGYG